LAWRIDYIDTVLKQLKRLDKQATGHILSFMEDRVGGLDDPRSFGKALHGTLGKFWCYRIGDYRGICDIRDQDILILVLQIGNRKEVYRRR
jgi:mRNA interferase RelE/StbE